MKAIPKKRYEMPIATTVEIQMQQVLGQSSSQERINLSGTLNGYTGEQQVWY